MRQFELEAGEQNRTGTSFLKKRLRTLNRDTRIFLLFLALTFLVIVSMSMYIIQEYRMELSLIEGNRLVNKNGELVTTGKVAQEIVGHPHKLLALDPDTLQQLESIAFGIRTTSGQIAEVIMRVDAVERDGTTGRIFGASAVLDVARNGASANYTSSYPGDCSNERPCKLVNYPPTAALFTGTTA